MLGLVILKVEAKNNTKECAEILLQGYPCIVYHNN